MTSILKHKVVLCILTTYANFMTFGDFLSKLMLKNFQIKKRKKETRQKDKHINFGS